MSVSKRHFLKYNPFILDGLLVWSAFFLGEFIRCEIQNTMFHGGHTTLMSLVPTLVYILAILTIPTKVGTQEKQLKTLCRSFVITFLVLSGTVWLLGEFDDSKQVPLVPAISTLFLQFVIGTFLLVLYRIMLVVQDRTTINHVIKQVSTDLADRGEKYMTDKSINALLNRPAIPFDSNNIANEVIGETILITGGAGSIGSEIVSQIRTLKPSKVVIIDQAETAMHYLERELEISEKNQVEYELIVADITDKDRLRDIFEEYEPTIIFHAAAYKHVPIMESNPQEAFNVNVLGTKNLADISVEYGIKKFIMISTDKAIAPSNIMGATKRLAEIYVQGLSRKGASTQFITTRFGNVLGSNGSVVPLFNKQIENGGPITITHQEVTRYFMTLPEACSLVLEAAAMGQGGEIFIFDMGEPIKIYDLALKLIRLHGLKPGQDIEIKLTGLRAGEKLHEELWSIEENTKPTAHSKIMKAYNKEEKFEMITKRLELVHDKVSTFSKRETFFLISDLLPEFKTNNEDFLKFDQSTPPWDEISSQ